MDHQQYICSCLDSPESSLTLEAKHGRDWSVLGWESWSLTFHWVLPLPRAWSLWVILKTYFVLYFWSVFSCSSFNFSLFILLNSSLFDNVDVFVKCPSLPLKHVTFFQYDLKWVLHGHMKVWEPKLALDTRASQQSPLSGTTWPRMRSPSLSKVLLWQHLSRNQPRRAAL